MRGWSMQIFLINSDGQDVDAGIFSKVTWFLHESFGNRAKQGS